MCGGRLEERHRHSGPGNRFGCKRRDVSSPRFVGQTVVVVVMMMMMRLCWLDAPGVGLEVCVEPHRG